MKVFVLVAMTVLSFSILVACASPSFSGTTTQTSIESTSLPRITSTEDTLQEATNQSSGFATTISATIISTEVSIAMATKNQTAAPTPIREVTPLPTIEIEPLSVTPTPAIVVPDLELIYVKQIQSDGFVESQVWTFHTATEMEQMIFSTSSNLIIPNNNVRWDPTNEDFIFFIQTNLNREWALWKLNLNSDEVQQVTEIQSGGFVLMGEWAENGKRLELLVGSNPQDIELALVNIDSGEIIRSDYRPIAWSPINSSQFLYYLASSDQEPFIIEQIDTGEILGKFKLPPDVEALGEIVLSDEVEVAWHPAGNEVAASINGNLYMYNLQSNQWSEQQDIGRAIRLLRWAHEGEWLVIDRFTNISIT